MRWSLSLLLLAACVDGAKGPASDDTSPAGDSGTRLDSEPEAETGSTEERGLCIPTRWYPDEDDDGYGVSSGAIWDCDSPRGYTATSDDCDDCDPLTYPGAAETCGDGVFNDCDDTSGAAAMAACPAEGPYQVSAADVQLLGYTSNQMAGSGVSGAGDANGDGQDDVLVATGWDGSGWAWRATGPLSGRMTLDVSTTLVAPGGSAVVANAGDQDGDGLPDMLVGAREYSDYQGRVAIVLATTTGTVRPSDLDADRLGEREDDDAGCDIDGVGDVNEDGWDDVLVGAFSWDNGTIVSAGAAYLIHGPMTGSGDLSTAAARIEGTENGGYLGTAVARGGDLNGDGISDLLMSAPGAGDSSDLPGTVYAAFGPVTGTMSASSSDVVIEGTSSEEWLGDGLGGAGDVNGDGYDDIVIGAPDGWGGDGGAFLVLGPASGTSTDDDAKANWIREDENDGVGNGVGIVGDVDADGFDDLLIGAPGANAAYLVYGPVSGTKRISSADMKFTGGPLVGGVGWSVSGAGDVDGDGLADLLIGAPWTAVEGEDAGAAYIVFAAGSIMSGGYGP